MLLAIAKMILIMVVLALAVAICIVAVIVIKAIIEVLMKRWRKRR